jgi:GT2 family glycosyltransferase
VADDVATEGSQLTAESLGWHIGRRSTPAGPSGPMRTGRSAPADPQWGVGQMDPDVTVVVVTHRAADFLRATLDGLAAQRVPHRLLMVDNASTDGTAEILAAAVAPYDILRLPANAGFAGGVAAALPLVRTRYLALLNDDAVPDPDWLAALLRAAEDDTAAAAWTSLMVLADRPDTVNNRGAAFNSAWYGIDVGAGEPVAAVPAGTRQVFGFCGGAALLRTAAVRAVGGFPADFFLYYEDLETSWRLRRAGWVIRTVPDAKVLHRHAATSDRRSEMFHFYNERNRVLTLIRCAPLPVAPRQVLHFALTTASLATKKALGRQVPEDANFRLRLRLRVLAAVLAMAPGQYRQRRPAARSRGRRPSVRRPNPVGS